MPYRPKDIYRGRRKFRVPLVVLITVLALLLAGVVGTFYFLQRFLVYDQSGVTLALPFTDRAQTAQAEITEDAPAFSPVEVQVIYDQPDFSDIDLHWQNVEAIRARFIPFSDAADEMKLNAAVASLPDQYTGVVLEVKNRRGNLAWASSTRMAEDYGIAGTMDYTETVAALHEKGLTAAAQLSVCADQLLATRNWPLTLKGPDGPYEDSDGVYWLDPYNMTLRNYIIELMEELAAMGFDELILADLYHPDTSLALTYSVTLQTEADPVNAVCQLARRLAEAMEEKATVSALIDTDSLREQNGAATGQDIAIFWRIFARLYCPTDYWNAASDLEYAAETMTVGDASLRFVPVSDIAPEGFGSYVIQ